MRCQYCGDDIDDEMYESEDEFFCSKGCAEAADFDRESDIDENTDIVYEEGFELEYSGELDD